MWITRLDFLKWAATLAIVSATIFRAVGYHNLDLVLSLLGSMLWSYIAFTWRERALLLLNLFSALVLLYGVFNYNL